MAFYLFFADVDKLNFTVIPDIGLNALFLFIIWISLTVDMLYRIIPNKRISMGARKHFTCSYSPAPLSAITPKSKKTQKGALLSISSWFLITATVLFLLHQLGLLTPAAVLLIVLAYAVFDLVFILIFCPFQVLFMRNRCCVVCRIYNWDYFMMCIPMILYPSVYSISLILLSLTVLIRWEVAFYTKPNYFTQETNENLQCRRCEDKLCLLRKKYVDNTYTP
ncbi:MAG: hypothetical protein FWE91_03840 [Defluviitaleaceae bacterium]|nr:hypothetical protein [Defluviitaleaceae bacterium]MCL2835965.1 hypothetical protein [Defluviitaleaceae bacterium]